MPLNTLRLNHQASSHPNERIVFIKPLTRPPTEQSDLEKAELILKAIAAQCLPIMKTHYLSVTTLEEHEPNSEFIGRNFNNGEIIQLVIRSKSGGWLPLNMIQMVMMHELAHNLHMNHGKGFWQTRNIYAGEMRQLWTKGYTGEGLWGTGRTLNALNDALGNNVVRSEELAELPVCGGTYRSRRRKRKAGGDNLTWKEKRDKRIEKKFGKNGTALGEDEDKRLELEIGHKGPMGVKPRVAQSKRGRELRAAAALARFDTNKKEVETIEAADKEDEDDQTEEDDYEEIDTDQPDAQDVDGSKLLDSKGNSMIRVCEDEDGNDSNVKQELEELGRLEDMFPVQKESTRETASASENPTNVHQEKLQSQRSEKTPNGHTNQISTPLATSSEIKPDKPNPQSTVDPTAAAPSKLIECPICTMHNDSFNSTCFACSHVLNFEKDPQHWRCRSVECVSRGSKYVNAGDCGVCGICGARKPMKKTQN